MDLLDLSSNLVPYKGLQFLSSAFSPMDFTYFQQDGAGHRPQAQKLRASTPPLQGTHPPPSCSKLLLDILCPGNQLLDVHPKLST